ncbi:MAG: hypothetical protein JW861_08560 [Bacteroidales bacterium]|nr:hypothetical protein [Bacteroidales bacterium]
MKKSISLLFLMCIAASCLMAQVPQAFRYQAVVRDTTGNPLINQQVSLRMSILQGSPSGTAVYAETHLITTSEYGLAILEVGNGTVVSGDFTAIDWGSDIFFLQVEIGDAFGTSYELMGTSQLMSVPYALQAKTDDDWVVSNTNMYSNVPGNVGIVTTSPMTRLHITGGTDASLTGHGYLVNGEIDQTNLVIDNNEIMARNNGNPATLYLQHEGGPLILNGLDGNVGIGTSYPSEKLHVNGNMRLTGALHDHGDQAGTAGQLLSSTGSGVSWIDDPGLWTDGTNYIYPENHGNFMIYNQGYSGGGSRVTSLYVFNNNNSEPNVSCVYGYLGYGVQGNGYGYNRVRSPIVGYVYLGYSYTFGVSGYRYNDAYPRGGGVFGGSSQDNPPNAWGSLGYRNSSGTCYGGYFTSTGSGSGEENTAYINSGIAAWGDLFGADIHGKIYGTFTEGKRYAMFSNGMVFKNDLDVHLQKTGGENTVLYTNVSTGATVMTSGMATLVNGKCPVIFDPAFVMTVSSMEPVVVTVTPLGNSNGVYLSDITANGFNVTENNGGKSNVTVTYIAVGKRAGYEHPDLPQEVIGTGYTAKISQGLHNDHDMETDGQGLYYDNGGLKVGIHPSVNEAGEKK